MVSILVLSCNFQQQSTTTADNFHQLPVAIPVSSNNGSEESYGSRPGSTEAAGMGPGLPVSSSARITADHMNGNFSPRNAAGITGRILNTCILITCKLLTQVKSFHQLTVFFFVSCGNIAVVTCSACLYFLVWKGQGVGEWCSGSHAICIMVLFFLLLWLIWLK